MGLMNSFHFLHGGLRLGHLLLALGAVGLLAVFAPSPAPDSRGARERSPAGAVAASPRNDAGSTVGGARPAFSLQGVADLFSSASWLPLPPPAVAAKPVAPGFPFHFVGTLEDGNNGRQVFLAQHGSGVIVTPKVGDLLAGAFKVEAINGESVSVLYVPLNEKLAVSFSSMGSEPGSRQTPGGAPVPEPVSAGPFLGAEPVRAVATTAAAAGTAAALPPIAGIAPAPAVAQAVPQIGTANPGGAFGGAILGTTPGGTSPTGIGSSPLTPGTNPSTATLGAPPAVTNVPLGTAPTNTGMLGTLPVNTDSAALFGPKPTSGGPGVTQ